MILSGDEIQRQVLDRKIIIEPFTAAHLGPNSYDVTLAPELRTYDRVLLDLKEDNPTRDEFIPPEGLVLYPGVLYLASVNERIGSSRYVPWLDGRSSVGRLGIQIHMTAGRGDLGWFGRYTLEICVVQPVRVYAHVRIGQVTFFEVSGGLSRQYVGRYQGQHAPTPSRLWQDFQK